jgi:hypothetical protein
LLCPSAAGPPAGAVKLMVVRAFTEPEYRPLVKGSP